MPLTLLVRITVSLGIGLLGSLLWIAVIRPIRARIALLVALLISLASFASILGLRVILPQTVAVTVESPISKTTIDGHKTVITGTISPPEARVTVLVHPVGKPNQDSVFWWVQEQPLATLTGDEGNRTAVWQATIYLGTETLGKDEAFEVIAVGSRDATLFDILTDRYLQAGESIASLPELSQSKLVILYRSNR